MVSAEVLLRAVAALVGITFAVLLLPAARRSRAALWLAVFLALVAVNQGAETMRSLAETVPEKLAWYRLASVVASLDPLALYLFASHLRPGRIRDPVRIALVAIPAFALAVWGAFLTTIPFINDRTFAYPITLSAFTGVVYTALLFWAMEGLLREPDRPAWRPLFVAISVMAIPVSATLTSNLFTGLGILVPFLQGQVSFLADMATTFVLVAAIAIVLVLRAPRTPGRDDRRFVVLSIAGALSITFMLKLNSLSVWLLVNYGVPHINGADVVGRVGAAIRFLLFGAFASTALLRHDALGLSLAARRRLSRVLIALAFIILGAGLIPLTELLLVGHTGALTPLEIGLLAAVAVLSQGFQRLVDGIAARIYGVPMRGDAAAAGEAYRRAVSAAILAGRNPAEDPDLARLRDELGLDATTASILERMADEGEGGPLREGLHVGGRYQVQRFLGAGGSGRAFLALDTRLQRRVVLKEVRDVGDGGEDAALAEARVAGGLASPHVVAVYDAFRRRGSWVLILEHAEGGSLEAALREGRVDPPRAAQLLRDVIEGVAAVHAKGIVHGDLKPQNVLLDAEGRARIADFGLARLARGRTAPLEGPAMGTPDFMAPEQRKGAPITARTDVFALGLLARRLYADRPPAALQPIVARATEEDPTRRYADAGDMLRALDAAAMASHQRQ